MKRLLMMVSVVALAFGTLAPTAQASGYTTSGQESGSEWCSGAQAELTPAAVGMLADGEEDWYSVTSDHPVVFRLRTTSFQLGTGIVGMWIYHWDPDATGSEPECKAGLKVVNDPVAVFAQLPPFPPGKYQVRLNAYGNHTPVPHQGYVLTATPA